MSQVEIDEAGTALRQLVERARGGEEIVLAEGGEELAKLVPIARQQIVRLGLAEGKYTIPDDFDAPLPDDVLALFYEGPIFPERTGNKQDDGAER